VLRNTGIERERFQATSVSHPFLSEAVVVELKFGDIDIQ